MRTLVFGILVGVTCLMVAGFSGCGDEACIRELAAASLEREANLTRKDTGSTGAMSPRQTSEGLAATSSASTVELPPLPALTPAVGEDRIASKDTTQDNQSDAEGIEPEFAAEGATQATSGKREVLPEMEEELTTNEIPGIQDAAKMSQELAEAARVVRSPAIASKPQLDDANNGNVPGLEEFALGTNIALPDLLAVNTESPIVTTVKDTFQSVDRTHQKLAEQLELSALSQKLKGAEALPEFDDAIQARRQEKSFDIDKELELSERNWIVDIEGGLKAAAGPANPIEAEKNGVEGVLDSGAETIDEPEVESIEDTWQKAMLEALPATEDAPTPVMEVGGAVTIAADVAGDGAAPAAKSEDSNSTATTTAEKAVDDWGSAEEKPATKSETETSPAASVEEKPAVESENAKPAEAAAAENTVDDWDSAEEKPAAKPQTETSPAASVEEKPAVESEKAKPAEAATTAKGVDDWGSAEEKPEVKSETKASPAASAKEEPAVKQEETKGAVKAEEPKSAAEPTDKPTVEKDSTSPNYESNPKVDLIALEKIRQEARLAEARHHYETGVKYFNAGQYSEALNFFDKAVLADPGLKDAIAMRTRARQLVGRTDNVEDNAQLMEEISRNQAARLRERELRINNSLEKASAYFISAVNPDNLRKTFTRIEQIKAGLDDLELAQQEAQGAEQLLQGAGLPKGLQKTLDMRIKALKAQIVETGRTLTDERTMIDRREAQQKAASQQQSLDERQAKETDQLFAAVELFFKRTEYDKALEAVEKIIATDPLNQKAVELRDKIRRANHQEARVDIDNELDLSQRNWAVDIVEAQIMPRKTLLYPLDWDRIKQRAKTVTMTGAVDFERQRIINALSSITGTVEYAELPLSLVLDDFRRRAKVNIMLNSEVDAETPITISLRNVTLWTAFETILQANSLEFSVKDQAMEIFKKGSSGSADVILKIFQVADLITQKKNYYAPVISSGEEGSAWSSGDDDDDDDEEWNMTQIPLKEQITKYVSPEKWPEESFAVELWDDNLLVKATPEVIAQVAKFLEKLRESAKLQVFVEGRFMDITDNFSELIGFDWTSTYSYQNYETNPSKSFQSAMKITPLAATNSINTYATNYNGNTGANMTGALQYAAEPVNYLLNTVNMKLVIDAAQNTQKGSVLHNPKVLVANGRNAYARVVVMSSYVTSYSIIGTNVLPVVTEIAQGVTWDVRPIVSFDHKYVTVRVRPKISEVDTTPGMTMNQTFTFDIKSGSSSSSSGSSTGSSGYRWTVNLTYPCMKEILFETNATIPDGGTLLIGGQLYDSSSESVTGIPVLASVPGVGRLFRTNTNAKNGTNRIIMVSAKIVELED